MTSLPWLISLARRCPLAWLFAFTFLAGAFAQTALTGTVTGRVFNPASKEYVGNAEVRLEGTSQVTYTESDGTFRFDHVPPGPASITVNFTGYTKVQESFAVTAGQTAVREINLTSSDAAAPKKEAEVIQLSAFTVSTEREGNSKAIMAQRRNMNISTSVSSDIFGNVTDGNVGEFLKYLPGVDLDYVESEARGPRLGGMDGQYVGVSFDGMRTASADANRGGGAASRATSFEGFSITSIESIEINLTASPENDGDAPAGTVNMKTKRAFDQKGRRIACNFGVNFNDQEFTLNKTPGPRDHSDYKWKPNYQLSYSDSFFHNRFGLLLSATRADSFTEQTSTTMGYNRSATAADPRLAVIRQIAFGDGPKFIHKDSLLLTADWKATQHLVLSLNMIYSYFDGEFWNRSFTWVAANDNANVNNGRSTVGGDAMTRVVATRAPSGSVNNQARLDNGGGSSSKLQYTRQFAPRFEYKRGAWVADGAMAYSRAVNNYESLERGFSNSEGGSVSSSWVATRPNPQSWEWTIRQTSGPDWYDLHNFTSTNASTGGTRVDNDDRTWATEKWIGNANARWTVPFMERFPTILKFGGKWDEETRKNNDHGDVSVWSYIGPGGNTIGVNPTTKANIDTAWGNWANLGPQYISPHLLSVGSTNSLTVYDLAGVQGMPPRPSRNAMADLFHAHPEQFVNTATPENWYTSYVANARDFRQTVTAGYAQADLRLGSRIQIRFGERLERTQNALTEFDPLTRAQVIAAGYTVNAVGTNGGRALTVPGLQYEFMSKPRITRRSQYHNWFPSIQGKYQILPDLEWQVGANRGIGRPAIDDLTGLWVLDESKLTVTAPNPDLLPEQHNVLKSRLVYYLDYSRGRSPGQLSLLVSQDQVSNYINTYTYTSAEFGVEDPAFSNYSFISNANVPGGQRLRNLDFSYNQTLGFLPSEYLRRISVGLNYSRSYADVRRVGLAPRRASSRLGYAYGRFSGSFGAVWRDNAPSESTYGRIMGAYTKYDLSLNWRLSRSASLYVQGRNISNVKDEWYESPNGVQEGQQRYLRKMEEYGANWVFGVQGQF